jgi:error-prone DNA polymerase
VFGIRLALKDVHGISDAEVRAILEARADRAFRSVDDFLRRAIVSRPVAERLAHAGAFDSLPSPRGSRRDRLYRAMTAKAPREGDQLALDLDATEVERAREADLGSPVRSVSVEGTERPSRVAERGLGGDWPAEQPSTAPSHKDHPPWPGLREYTEAERVRAELEVLEVDASRHLISFYEPLLAELGVTRSKDLNRCRSGQWVTVAGVKVSTQTPLVRSQRRIIFLTLDDATGPVDVTVFDSVQDRCARTVFHAFVLAIRGRVRRTGVRGVSVVAEEAYDVAALQRERRAASRPPGPPPKKLWHASGGSAGW